MNITLKKKYVTSALKRVWLNKTNRDGFAKIGAVKDQLRLERNISMIACTLAYYGVAIAANKLHCHHWVYVVSTALYINAIILNASVYVSAIKPIKKAYNTAYFTLD